MQVESLAIADLQFDPANARKHSEKNLGAIKGSLAKFGQQKPIVIDKNNVVIAGNGTLAAAKELGWDKIGAVRTHLTGPEAIAFALADNRSSELAEWDIEALGKSLRALDDIDFDLGAIGFDMDDMEKLAPDPIPEGLTDPDEVPDEVDTRCKPGDLWQLGNHRLLCGDSTNVQHVERLMGGEKADLCFTSPPYADQRQYNGGKDLSTEFLATFIRTAAPHVDLFAVNLGVSRKDGEVNCYWDDYIKEAKSCGLRFLSWNVWDQGFSGSVGKLTAMFPICHEWIFVFGAERKRLRPTVANKTAGEKNNYVGDRQPDGNMKKKPTVEIRDKRELGTVLTLSPQVARDERVHPAMFPVALPQTYIEACTSPNKGVYEPFSGSGSTLIACEKTGRKCYGMEIDPHYCDVIVARWENYTGKKATLIAG